MEKVNNMAWTDGMSEASKNSIQLLDQIKQAAQKGLSIELFKRGQFFIVKLMKNTEVVFEDSVPATARKALISTLAAAIDAA